MANSEWSYNQLVQGLAQGLTRSSYLLYGEESFLVERGRNELVRTAFDESFRDFNLNVFDADEADAQKVKNALETLPMMTPFRVVVLNRAHVWPDREWESLYSTMQEFLAGSAPQGVVFICCAEKLDRRKKHWKFLLESGVSVDCKRPYDNQIPEWIEYLSRTMGLKLDREAVAAVQQVVGNNLGDIAGELSKLSHFVSQKDAAKTTKQRNVTADEVFRVASPVRIESVFDFAEAIGRGDRGSALKCLSKLLAQGQNEIGVLSLVARHIRILRVFLEGKEQGLSGPKLAAKAGISPYFSKSYQSQVSLWNHRKLDQTFEALLEIDRALKTSSLAGHLWLENLVFKVC